MTLDQSITNAIEALLLLARNMDDDTWRDVVREHVDRMNSSGQRDLSAVVTEFAMSLRIISQD